MAFSDKEFLADLAELASSLRRDIDAFSTGLDPSPDAIASRRKRVLCDADFRFFAYNYFPHHIRGESSLFQAHFCQIFPQLLLMPNGVREWWVAPRGEAKSSLATKIGPVFVVALGLLQRDEIRREVGWQGNAPAFLDYLLLLGAETSLPTKLLEVIKTELTVNSALALDFPEICGKGPNWKVGEIVTKNGVKIEPFGAEQAVRGTFHGASRPKVLFGDDLITDAEAKSATERDNRWTWLEKATEYLGPPDGSVKFIGVGTVLNKDDPISRANKTVGHTVHPFKAIEVFPTHMNLWEQCQELMLNVDRRAIAAAQEEGKVLDDTELPSYRFYLENKEMMDEGAVTSWPQVRSLFWLMRQRAKSPRAFATEMQGDGRADEDRVFSHITYWEHRAAQWLIFGACDPSMGANEKSDPSSIVVGGLDVHSLKLHVLLAEIKRRVPSKLESDLIKMQKEFNCLAIGFENNNAYEWARQSLIKAGLQQGVPLPLVGVTATVAPEVRIDSLEPFVTDIAAPQIIFNKAQTTLLAELDTWPEKQSGHHYDGLTALHILWMIAQTRGRAYGSRYIPVPKRGNSGTDARRDPMRDRPSARGRFGNGAI